jgi:hypothetical protein
MQVHLKFGKTAIALTAAVVATAAIAATLITVKEPIAVSDGIMGDKPKLQRAGDGALIRSSGLAM